MLLHDCKNTTSGIMRILGDCDTSHIAGATPIAHVLHMKSKEKESAVPVILAVITALLVCFILVLSYEAIHSAPKSDVTYSN